MKAKKGFTLIEMGVAMGVFAIVVAMVTLVLVTVQKFSNQKQQITAVNEEVQTFQTNFTLALEDYQLSTWALLQITQSTNEIVFEKDLSTQKISFENQTLKQNGTTLATFKTINSAMFTTNKNLIKCTLTFSDNTQPQTLIFNKRI